MAVTFSLSGDRFGPDGGQVIPAAYASARYSAPAVWHLVKQDTTAAFNDGVVQCVASDVPLAFVRTTNSGNGTLGIMLLTKTLELVMECANTPTLGHDIQANGTPGTIPIGGFLRDQVKDVAAGTGVGKIVAIDPAGGTPILIKVRFP